MAAMLMKALPGRSPKGMCMMRSIAPSAEKASTACAAPLLNTAT